MDVLKIKETIKMVYNEVSHAMGVDFSKPSRKTTNIIALDIYSSICYNLLCKDYGAKSQLITIIGDIVDRSRLTIYCSIERFDIKMYQYPEYKPLYERTKEICEMYIPKYESVSYEVLYRERIIKKQKRLIKKAKECI